MFWRGVWRCLRHMECIQGLSRFKQTHAYSCQSCIILRDSGVPKDRSLRGCCGQIRTSNDASSCGIHFYIYFIALMIGIALLAYFFTNRSQSNISRFQRFLISFPPPAPCLCFCSSIQQISICIRKIIEKRKLEHVYKNETHCAISQSESTSHQLSY